MSARKPKTEEPGNSACYRGEVMALRSIERFMARLYDPGELTIYPGDGRWWAKLESYAHRDATETTIWGCQDGRTSTEALLNLALALRSTSILKP